MHPNHATLNGITKCLVSSELGETTMKHFKPWAWDTFECIPQNLGVMRKKNVDFYTMCSSPSLSTSAPQLTHTIHLFVIYSPLTPSLLHSSPLSLLIICWPHGLSIPSSLSSPVCVCLTQWREGRELCAMPAMLSVSSCTDASFLFADYIMWHTLHTVGWHTSSPGLTESFTVWLE